MLHFVDPYALCTVQGQELEDGSSAQNPLPNSPVGWHIGWGGD